MNFFKFSKNDVYKTKFFLYQYTDTYFRIVKQKYHREKGFEEIKKRETYIPLDKSEIDRVSISRTRRNIRELALCNDFQYFVTLTVNSKNCDRFSLTETQTKLRFLFKKIKRRNKDFAYLFITEKHENGAFHFHGLIKNIDDLYINNNGYYSSSTFDELGFNSFSKIKNYIKCCNYILKYITKDCVKNEAGTVYISSRGLKKADVSEINPSNVKWNYENDFCSIKDFDLSELTLSEKLDFFNFS